MRPRSGSTLSRPSSARTEQPLRQPAPAASTEQQQQQTSTAATEQAGAGVGPAPPQYQPQQQQQQQSSARQVTAPSYASLNPLAHRSIPPAAAATAQVATAGPVAQSGSVTQSAFVAASSGEPYEMAGTPSSSAMNGGAMQPSLPQPARMLPPPAQRVGAVTAAGEFTAQELQSMLRGQTRPLRTELPASALPLTDVPHRTPTMSWPVCTFHCFRPSSRFTLNGLL